MKIKIDVYIKSDNTDSEKIIKHLTDNEVEFNTLYPQSDIEQAVILNQSPFRRLPMISVNDFSVSFFGYNPDQLDMIVNAYRNEV